MTDANRRRLILLARARTRAVDATGLVMRLVEDLTAAKIEGDPVQYAWAIVDVLVQLQGRLETEIGEVPSP